MIIFGIDPGTATTGYGVIQKNRVKGRGPAWKYIAYGRILTPKTLSRGKRLLMLEKELSRLLNVYKPDLVAVEMLFFFNNARTVMSVSEARGVIHLCIAKKNLPVREFAPAQVKMIVTGHGRAEKKDMQKKVKKLLALKEAVKSDDAADALGIALACASFLQHEVLS